MILKKIYKIGKHIEIKEHEMCNPAHKYSYSIQLSPNTLSLNFIESFNDFDICVKYARKMLQNILDGKINPNQYAGLNALNQLNK